MKNDALQRVNVMSSSGVKIVGDIDGDRFEGQGIVNLERSRSARTIHVETSGCAETTTVSSSVDPLFYANLLTIIPIGSLVDFYTGEMWRYESAVVVQCDDGPRDVHPG